MSTAGVGNGKACVCAGDLCRPVRVKLSCGDARTDGWCFGDATHTPSFLGLRWDTWRYRVYGERAASRRYTDPRSVWLACCFLRFLSPREGEIFKDAARWRAG